MTNASKLLAPALIALAMFGFSSAHAGQAAGGDGETDKVKTPSTPAPGGGGETDKVKTPPAPGGGGDTDKVRTPPAPGPAPQPPGGNGGGGRGDVVDYHQITCVVNGQVFQVRSTRECYMGSQYHDGGIGGGGGYGLGGGYAYKFHGGQGYGAEYAYGGEVQVYRPHVRHQHMRVDGGFAIGGGYGFEGGYGYAPQPRIRYYHPASPAAVMQTERRQREAQYGYGDADAYGFAGGYAAGYGYGGGYGFEGQMNYGVVDGYVRHHRKHGRMMRHARHMSHHGYGQMQGSYGYGPDFGQVQSYDPGFVLHYGPTLTKDGGY